MPPITSPIDGLERFLPPNTFHGVLPYFQKYTIQLTIKAERKRVLGDYRNPTPQSPIHKISINGTLNPYSFLITLLHELAHLETFVQYKGKVAAHGKEWKIAFQKIMLPFLQQQLLPSEIAKAVMQYMNNIKASTCGDPLLYKTLAKYDRNDTLLHFIDELPIDAYFKYPSNGKIYQIKEKRRTRYRCIELRTQVPYLFPTIAQVEWIENLN